MPNTPDEHDIALKQFHNKYGSMINHGQKDNILISKETANQYEKDRGSLKINKPGMKIPPHYSTFARTEEIKPGSTIKYEKDTKPPPTLDYAMMNRVNIKPESKHTLNYKEMNQIVQKPEGPTLDYSAMNRTAHTPSNNGVKPPKPAMKKSANEGDEVKRIEEVLRKLKSYKKQELNKGMNGDWQKEGYKLTHKLSPTGLTVFAHHPKDLDKYGNPLPGKSAGSAFYSKNIVKDKIYPQLVSVQPEHQRKGLASAMHDYAKNITKMDIAPSSNLSEQGKKFQDSYIEKK